MVKNAFAIAESLRNEADEKVKSGMRFLGEVLASNPTLVELQGADRIALINLTEARVYRELADMLVRDLRDKGAEEQQ